MQPRRLVILADIISGVDPLTGRPLPPTVENAVVTMGEFEPIGLQTKVLGGIQQGWFGDKIKIRKWFFKRQGWIVAPNDNGQMTLFRFRDTGNVMEHGRLNPDLIWLIVSEQQNQTNLNAILNWAET